MVPNGKNDAVSERLRDDDLDGTETMVMILHSVYHSEQCRRMFLTEERNEGWRLKDRTTDFVKFSDSEKKERESLRLLAS
ncbi:hypothetical protein BY996DRAFT_6556983 [Phakopsora pachyrhizi]|uniref:Uncharacterized protein n=1 Tax=Phakopsora pachyrhizi TaxID=170000 RepID=A0AAV0B1D5_PHAPC|nr:hypothetical protein BY996DRAFT_6556983 [Phakopsora pachyrhizi]CAH7677042.1 hypothetical protein PPACK8108_LOCUS12168 [Phakopsora pachyrhizi]